LTGGSNYGGVVFDFAMLYLGNGATCEIELRCQLITNSKSYMNFRLQQKSMTLNDLERQFTGVVSVTRAVSSDQTAEAKIMLYLL